MLALKLHDVRTNVVAGFWPLCHTCIGPAPHIDRGVLSRQSAPGKCDTIQRNVAGLDGCSGAKLQRKQLRPSAGCGVCTTMKTASIFLLLLRTFFRLRCPQNNKKDIHPSFRCCCVPSSGCGVRKVRRRPLCREGVEQ